MHRLSGRSHDYLFFQIYELAACYCIRTCLKRAPTNTTVFTRVSDLEQEALLIKQSCHVLLFGMVVSIVRCAGLALPGAPSRWTQVASLCLSSFYPCFSQSSNQSRYSIFIHVVVVDLRTRTRTRSHQHLFIVSQCPVPSDRAKRNKTHRGRRQPEFRERLVPIPARVLFPVNEWTSGRVNNEPVDRICSPPTHSPRECSRKPNTLHAHRHRLRCQKLGNVTER